MLSMRVWAAKLAAAGVIVAVVSSAVLTCVPGAMSVHDAPMSACASMRQAGGGLSADVATNCCVRHELFLTAARIDLRQVPFRSLASGESVMSPTVAATAVARRAETPPGLTSTLGPPVYITLSTLRV